MPNIDYHFRAVEAKIFIVDCDVGEMFRTFMLQPSLGPHTGFDLNNVFPEEKNGNLKGWRKRITMGFGPSPYLVTKDMLVVEEGVRGVRLDPENVFRWHTVTLNLPGMDKYESSRTWVYKVRYDGTMAADLFFYIDDDRLTALSAWEY